MKTANSITRSNYEAYMVDYWDGTLTPPLREMLLLFLDENPDIKKEVMDAGQFTLPEETVTFENKNDLFRKEVSESTIDEFLVSELEHELLPHEQNEVSIFIASNPQYKRDRALYALTKLRPDKNLVYPFKNDLKKGIAPLWVRYARVAVAACLFLGVGIWWFNQPKVNEVAHNPTSIEKHSGDITPNNRITETPQPGSVEAITNNKRTLTPVNNTSLPSVVKHDKNPLKIIPVKEAATENFNSYSKNRRSDDYLGGLVNTYVPYEVTLIPVAPKEEEPKIIEPKTNRTVGTSVNDFASRNLLKIIKDSAFAREIESRRYSVKTKVAKAIAWATGKASNGKVRIEAIPNNDGSLAAMSFSNGRYNYTKKF